MTRKGEHNCECSKSPDCISRIKQLRSIKGRMYAPSQVNNFEISAETMPSPATVVHGLARSFSALHPPLSASSVSICGYPWYCDKGSGFGKSTFACLIDSSVMRGSRFILNRRKTSVASSSGCVWIRFKRSRKSIFSFSSAPSLFCSAALRLLSDGPISYSLRHRPQTG